MNQCEICTENMANNSSICCNVIVIITVFISLKAIHLKLFNNPRDWVEGIIRGSLRQVIALV